MYKNTYTTVSPTSPFGLVFRPSGNYLSYCANEGCALSQFYPFAKTHSPMLQSSQVHVVALLSYSASLPNSTIMTETATFLLHRMLKGPVWAVWPSCQAYRYHKQQPFPRVVRHRTPRAGPLLSYKVTLVAFGKRQSFLGKYWRLYSRQ